MSKKKNAAFETPEEKKEEVPTEEIPAEAPEGEAQEPVAEEPDPMQKALDEANAKAAEYLALAQRVQADFENFRRRNESVRADAYADGRKDTAALMLPVLDNLERALLATGEESALRSGVELTLKQLQDVFTRMNVSAIDRAGEVFDPNLENAVMQAPPEEGEPGTVCQVLQKGYRMGDPVLRHAMVKVVAE